MNRLSRTEERGSIVLFALFVCVAIAVLVQTLSVIIICADRTAEAENQGRKWMKDKDTALAGVREDLLSSWGPRGWSTASVGSQDVQTAVAELSESGGRALEATARHSAEVSPISVAAWVERGRDGLDLPLAGLVAGDATWTTGRSTTWLEMDGLMADAGGHSVAEGRPAAWLQTVPQTQLVGGGVVIGALRAPWKLDQGWRELLETPGGGAEAGSEGVAPVSATTILRGPNGTTVRLPSGWGAEEGNPGLLVVVGGASLDAVGRGDLYGVIVVDDGALSLDGTRVHGAVFATKTVDFGMSGEILFAPATLRWATDRSLVRTRLVPGSRREAIE